MTPPKPVLGLIGGIGAGKTAAAGCLAARGGLVIDCDKLGHVALEQPEVKAKLRARWGGGVFHPDGSVSRKAVAGVVFDTPDERKWLESVVFPAIGRMADERIAEANADPAVRFSVLDAAVLLEAGWKDRCDRILYIDAPRELRLQRLVARSGWESAELTSREAAQWPAEEKVRHADAVVTNDAGLSELQQRIDRVLNDWSWITDRDEPRTDHV
jgi:dephospho-CoA kinase